MKDWEKKVRTWAWERLVFLADRISPEDAFRATGMYVHLKKGEGWVIAKSEERKGIQIWYKGTREYDEHAYDGFYDSDEPKITNTVFNVGGMIFSADTAAEELDRMLRRGHGYGLDR